MVNISMKLPIVHSVHSVGSIAFMLLLAFPSYAQPQQDTLAKKQNYSTIGPSVFYGLGMPIPITSFKHSQEFGSYMGVGINFEHRFRHFSLCSKFQIAQFGPSQFSLIYQELNALYGQTSIIFKHEDYEFSIGSKYYFRTQMKKRAIVNAALLLTGGFSYYHLQTEYIEDNYYIGRKYDQSYGQNNHINVSYSLSRDFWVGHKFIIEPQVIFNQMVWGKYFPSVYTESAGPERKTSFRYHSCSIGCNIKYRI